MVSHNISQKDVDGYTKIVYNFIKNGGQLTDKDVRYIRCVIIFRVVLFKGLIWNKYGERLKLGGCPNSRGEAP